MIIICNDLSVTNQEVKEAVKNKDSNAIQKIAQTAKDEGFNSLELNGGVSDTEAENLLFLINSTKDLDLEYVLDINNINILKEVLKKSPKPGIISPKSITKDNAQEIFGTLKELDENWSVLFPQVFDNVSEEVEGMKGLIATAEQLGVLPDLLYVEPIKNPLISNDRSFLNMKRMTDALSNIYPYINFYVDLPRIAEGLDDEDTLLNVFIGMADMIGISAFAFSTKHQAHLKAIKAARALLNEGVNLKDY